MTLTNRSIDFALPDRQVATIPPERRGLRRDGVRMMIARRWSGEISHDVFGNLVDHLSPGDALVVNVSATIPAALDARLIDGARAVLHIASPDIGGLWAVEVRTPTRDGGTSPGPDLKPQTLRLPGAATADLLARNARWPRLWMAAVDGIDDLAAYLSAHGRAIRYVPGPQIPIDEYQSVFATVPGSAEIPSAARPFTPELVTRLVSNGVSVLPVLLHAGLSSFEDHEIPGEERYRVPETTAETANVLRARGGRIIAVGTTVVRALETAADSCGIVHPNAGVTDLVVTPQRGVRAIDGMITGWHEPRSSHLMMLEAVAGRDLLQRVYDESLEQGYLWHEFGDSLLILP